MHVIAEVFSEICHLANRLGISNIKELPACWEVQLDDQWWFAVNGHNEITRCSHGIEVPPFEAYIEYNGWPAGFVGPHGGTLAAGEAANEDTFIEALHDRKPHPCLTSSRLG